MSFLKFPLFFIVIFFSNVLLANSDDNKISQTRIFGNKSISKLTILNIADIKNENFTVNIEKLNQIQKKLYESNFFSKVSVKINNNFLDINVEENPLVDYFIIEGLEDNSEYKKFIENKLLLKSDAIYSEILLNKDVIFIKEYLSSQGYFNAEVLFSVKKNESRVNVFLKINLNNKYSIKNIFFIGNKVFSSSKLLDIVTSREEGLLSFFNSKSVPSLDRLNNDISLLKNFYLTEGFYDVQISSASIEVIDKKNVNITFSINAGERYTLVSYKLGEDLSFLKENEIKKVKNIISDFINVSYNYQKINQLRDLIVSYLDSLEINSNVGYNISKISQNKLNLFIDIRQVSKKIYVRNIDVVGNDITEERIVRNNLFFAEGDIFNNNKILRAQDNLESLGIFKKVDIVKEFLNSDSVNIKIDVQEKPTGEISAGLGIGSAGSSISFSIAESNFLGKNILLNSNVSLGTEEIIANISFSDPDFINSGNTFKNNFFISRNTYTNAGYENKIIGNNISVKYDIYDKISLEQGFGISYDTVTAYNTASGIVASQDGNYLTTKYFYNFFNDQRNKKFQTTSGYLLGFGQDVAFAPSDIPSLTNQFFGSHYKLLSEDFIGNIRYKLKSLNSFNSSSVKLSDRLFVNESELRGFASRGIGPKIGGDYIGGNYLYTSSISTTVPNGLPDTWNAKSSIFFDIANLWGSDISGIQDFNKIRSSVGVGFTWSSPLGPITLSYAEPISKKDTDKIQNLNFRLGSIF